MAWQVDRLPVAQSAVAQAYVARPLLIDGRKFHLRLYLVIASLTPLRVHRYDDGLVCSHTWGRAAMAREGAM